MTLRSGCLVVLVAGLLGAGCGNTTSADNGDEDRPTSSSTGVPYNDEDNDGQAPAEG